MTRTKPTTPNHTGPIPNTCHRTRPLIHAALACPLILTSACATLLTGTSDPAALKKIMESTHARGCIYARASAAPWAQATTIIIGTWGTNPPPYEKCWQGLPTGVP